MPLIDAGLYLSQMLTDRAPVNPSLADRLAATLEALRLFVVESSSSETPEDVFVVGQRCRQTVTDHVDSVQD